MTFQSIDEVKDLNQKSGHYFFSKDTMKFFESKIETDLIGGRYFVTSESSSFDDRDRKFTIREALPNGDIKTVGEFGGYKSRHRAKQACELLVVLKKEGA